MAPARVAALAPIVLAACTAGHPPAAPTGSAPTRPPGSPPASSPPPPPGSPSGATSPPAPSPAAASSPGPVTAALAGVENPAGRYRTMGASVGRAFYLLGGLDSAGISSGDVYRIDVAAGSITRVGQLATPTHGGAAVGAGSQILVLGGADTVPDDLVQDFDPASGTATVIGHMPPPGGPRGRRGRWGDRDPVGIRRLDLHLVGVGHP